MAVHMAQHAKQLAWWSIVVIQGHGVIRNQDVATLLDNIAELLEAKGESVFRIGAYRRAAKRIGSMPDDIEAIWKNGRLEEIPGVGESIATKIDEFLRTGHLEYLDEIRMQVAPGLTTLLVVPGIGSKRAHMIWEALGVASVADLGRAAREHRLCHLPRIGERLEADILREVERVERRTRRLLLGIALPAAEEIAALLRSHPAVVRAEPAGSIRRMRETIGDIDILAASSRPSEAINAFCELAAVREVVAAGSTKATVLVAGDLQMDLRVVAPDEFGAALLYFTGSKEHNIALREIALRRGLKLSEYGIFDVSSGARLASATEEDVYRVLGLPLIPPEPRENRGEIEAALSGDLPRLVQASDLQGDLHVHTKRSDGMDTLEVMAEAARARGYHYVVITDHSPGLGIARGLTPERVQEQHAEIQRLNRRMRPFRVLHGAEVSIRRDGTLEYTDAVLTMFDLVAASVHSAFDQPRDEITARVLRAIRHPSVDVLGHPLGRKLGEREEIALDLDAVIREARLRNVALEIDSQPERLDLPDTWAPSKGSGGITFYRLGRACRGPARTGALRHRDRPAWLGRVRARAERAAAQGAPGEADSSSGRRIVSTVLQTTRATPVKRAR
jgi:DNA polymerase (family 10)